jgi:hypothetical protein
VKTTPTTAPTVALPTERIPAEVNVIPAGRGAPLVEMPKVPPWRTPLGSVVARPKVEPLPAKKYSEPTFQDGGGSGAGTGGGITFPA